MRRWRTTSSPAWTPRPRTRALTPFGLPRLSASARGGGRQGRPNRRRRSPRRDRPTSSHADGPVKVRYHPDARAELSAAAESQSEYRAFTKPRVPDQRSCFLLGLRCRRHCLLLGLHLRWGVHSAGRCFHPDLRRQLPHVRVAGRRFRRLLGRSGDLGTVVRIFVTPSGLELLEAHSGKTQARRGLALVS